MAGPLSSGLGGLQVGQYLYPATLTNGELVPAGNIATLAAGQSIQVPRGRWMIDLGPYAVLQYYDPTSTTWRMFNTSRPGPNPVDSDGYNVRVANMTGCAIAAIVTNGGSAYVQASTTVTPSAGNSQWQAVVGGRVSTTVSVSAAGGGYTIPPMVLFPPPPTPGVQATAVAVLSSGTVSSITVINQGAGYATAPVPTIVPNPLDPAVLAGAITSNATAVATLTGSGQVSAVLCTNNGASFSTVPSLTIAGAGTSAAATIVPMWTTSATSVTSGGAGYTTNDWVVTGASGTPVGTPTYINPEIECTNLIPRSAMIAISAAGGGTISTIGAIVDGGLFFASPTAVVLGGAQTTPATIVVTAGSANATVRMQKVD